MHMFVDKEGAMLQGSLRDSCSLSAGLLEDSTRSSCADQVKRPTHPQHRASEELCCCHLQVAKSSLPAPHVDNPPSSCRTNALICDQNSFGEVQCVSLLSIHKRLPFILALASFLPSHGSIPGGCSLGSEIRMDGSRSGASLRSFGRTNLE